MESKQDPLHDPVGAAMVLAFARRIDQHVEVYVQNTFIRRTGIARNRIFRIRDRVANPDATEEIRFSLPELQRIAKELRYSSTTAMIEDIEGEALKEHDQETDETVHRRRSIELAALFLKLSESELDRMRQALELVTAREV